MITVHDRYVATLLGVHIGDSIWAPFETDTASEVQLKLRMLNGLRFHKYKNPWPEDNNGEWLSAGRPTDDSDQTAALGHSLLCCNGIDQLHLWAALRKSVIDGESLLWRGQATGAGGTTRAMLGDDVTLRSEAKTNPVASNGSLMRSAAIALWLGPTPHGYTPQTGADFQMVKAMSEVTHVHPDSIAACWLYVRMLRNALAGREIDDFEIQSPFDLRIGDYLLEVEKDGCLPPDPGSFKAGWGGAEYTLKVALHAVRTTHTFTDTILTVGLAGGDTDTYGAVAGGLAGAIYGQQDIPKKWQNIIFGKGHMTRLATELYEAQLQTAS